MTAYKCGGSRARNVALLFGCLALPFSTIDPASAQDWPARSVAVVVPLGAGSASDIMARVVSDQLSRQLNRTFVVENRPGAGGTIATEMAARAAPDGYTLVMASPGHAITPSLYKLTFDAIRDFEPITLVVAVPYVVVVHPSLPVRSIKELLALARARPDELLWSSSGNGSAQHLTLELFKTLTGAKIVHVPYKGTAPGMVDLVGGRVSATSASVIATMPHVRAGRLRAIAVAGRTRTPAAPELPTIVESGVPNCEIDVWHGLLAPAGTPRVIIARLHNETVKVLARPETKQRLLAAGFDPIGDPPEKFAAYLKAEVAKWAKVVREANIRID
jgi:tripartite-type tricarboxylate transporter receptor subunit TctC